MSTSQTVDYSASLAAFKKRAAFEIQSFAEGEEEGTPLVALIVQQKRGAARVVDYIVDQPVLAELIEALVDMQVKNKGKAIDKDAGLEMLRQFAARAEMGVGAFLLTSIKTINGAISAIVVDNTVEVRFPDGVVMDCTGGQNREVLEDLVRGLDIGQLFDGLSCFVKLNFPGFHGPFVRATAAALIMLEKLPELMTTLASDLSEADARDASEPVESSDPSTETPAAA